MSNNVFPVMTGLDWNVEKTPQFSTRIQKAVSGKEIRAAFFSYPLYTFKMKYNVLRDTTANAELRQLLGFFLSRQGSFDSFLFEDVSDYTVTDQLFGTGDGADTTFQLVRSYGGFSEPIMNVHAITNIKVNDVITTAYTIDSNGLVTFTSPPPLGHSVKWTGTYYYRCRFADDEADLKNFMQSLWEYKSCEMVGSLGDKI